MFSSFKSKVQQFWLAFSEEEATIREMIDNEVEGNTLISFTKSILKIAFTDIEFQLGINLENKYELTLSPQGDRIKLIQYHYWLKYAPKHLKKRWDFFSSKPALVNTKYEVDMFGVNLTNKDLLLYPEINYSSSKIELKVYCPKLQNLSDSQRYSMFFIFLDQYISELYSIEHISNIEFIREKLKGGEIEMTSLKEYIDSAITENGWINSDNPLDAYLGYKVKRTDKKDWILREDIAAGYSSCTSPISSYHFKDETFFTKYKEEGVIFGFIFYENLDIPQDEIVPTRATIEDEIIERTVQHGIANCIGGATGFHFSYIDLIIYDYEAFLKIVKSIMSTYTFEEAGFSYFLSGSKPIMLSEVTI